MDTGAALVTPMPPAGEGHEIPKLEVGSLPRPCTEGPTRRNPTVLSPLLRLQWLRAELKAALRAEATARMSATETTESTESTESTENGKMRLGEIAARPDGPLSLSQGV